MAVPVVSGSASHSLAVEKNWHVVPQPRENAPATHPPNNDIAHFLRHHTIDIPIHTCTVHKRPLKSNNALQCMSTFYDIVMLSIIQIMAFWQFAVLPIKIRNLIKLGPGSHGPEIRKIRILARGRRRNIGNIEVLQYAYAQL